MHLSWIDYAIVFVYIGGTIIAGTLARGAIKGISDFLVAGRGLKTHMAVATMVSTGLGLVTVMYMAEEGFKYGFVPFVFGVMALITSLIIGRTGFIVSRLRHLQVMTVPEFYELKYTRGVRLLGGIILTLAGTLNMGLFPILGSKFVVGFTGLDKEYVNYVMVAMLVIVVFYTLMGGMVSVVLTDFAQFVLLAAGFLFGTYVILNHPQLGWDNMVQAVQTHHGDLGLRSHRQSRVRDIYDTLSILRRLSRRSLATGDDATAERREPQGRTAGLLDLLCHRYGPRVGSDVLGNCSVDLLWRPQCRSALRHARDARQNPAHWHRWPANGGHVCRLYVNARQLPTGLERRYRPRCGFTHQGHARQIGWQSSRGRNLGWAVERARGLLGARHCRYPGRLSRHFRRTVPTAETAFRFMYVTGSIYFSGCVGTIALRTLLEEGQYAGRLLRTHTRCARAHQLPHHDRESGTGAGIFTASRRKQQSRRFD